MTADFYPESEAECLELVKNALDKNATISISGQNTKLGFGYSSSVDSNICMSSFNGILEYDPAELVMRAKAGTALIEIEEALSEQGQYLAFEPPGLGKLYADESTTGTIGGVFMGNLSGPRRFLAGAARDHILGVKAINGRAEVYKSGGNVIKNVTGYDLSKLLAGSWGTLSLVTEFSFKVLPAPPSSESIGIQGLDTDSCLDLLSRIAQSPLQASGLACLPARTLTELQDNKLSLTNENLCLIRLEGSQLSINDRKTELQRLLPVEAITIFYDHDESKMLWQQVRDPSSFIPLSNDDCIMKVSIPPAQAKTTTAVLNSIEHCYWYADAAGGTVWVSFQQASALDNINILRQSLADSGASTVLFRAPEQIKRQVGIFSEMSDSLMSLNKRLKESFDPKHIINPKRLFLHQ